MKSTKCEFACGNSADNRHKLLRNDRNIINGKVWSTKVAFQQLEIQATRPLTVKPLYPKDAK